MTRARPARAQLNVAQVVINSVVSRDSGTAVDFYALFPDAASAQRLVSAFQSAAPALGALHR